MADNRVNDSGVFNPGPTGGTCIDAWSPPEEVQNAHDRGNRDQYRAPINNNASPLSPAPSANR